MKPTIEEVKTWAAEAGQILRDGFNRDHQIRHKAKFDLVTEVDTASEALILSKIRSHYPESQIITEESGEIKGQDGTWYIDPLDGTINYAHGMPLFAVSMAYSEGGQVKLGVVYDPIHEEMFWAERGKGAYLNNERLHVSQIEHLTNSLLVTGFPYDVWNTNDNNLDNYGRFARMTQGVRRLGSAALDLCYVAAGRIDGYWEIRIKLWDVAAGTLIAEEAGGVVTDVNGSTDILTPPISIVAATPGVHAEMMKVFREKIEV